MKFLCRLGKWRSTAALLPLAIPRLIRCDYTKERMGRNRERERERLRRRRNELRAVKQPEAEIPSGYLSQRALPFKREIATREREREDLSL